MQQLEDPQVPHKESQDQIQFFQQLHQLAAEVPVALEDIIHIPEMEMDLTAAQVEAPVLKDCLHHKLMQVVQVILPQ